MNGPNGAEVTVLISSAGRRVELIRCFREDAARLGMSVRVIATDVDPTWSSACGAADVWFEVPRSTDRGFVDRMVELCEQNAVSIVVPTIDTELAVLSESVDRFGGVPTVVAVSTPGVVALARDKAATAAFLSSIGVPTPRTALASEAAGQSWSGPVIVKPRGGSSSIGIKRLRSIGELTEEDATSANVVQELLAGEEYTVNVYFGPDGALRAAVPHWRRETRAGEVSKGQTRRHPALEQEARRLGDGLSGARGAL